MNINWKARLTNKAWLVSTVSLIVLLLQQIGLGQLADYIPKNYADIINSILLIAGAFGVAVDTSTPGISDTIKSPTEVQNSNDNSINSATQNNVQAKIDTSASAKVQVDNPDNIKAIGQEVNHISAVSPSKN